MTIANSNNRSGPLAANGVIVDFDFDFKILDSGDLDVYDIDALGVASLVDTADYTVAISTTTEGGTVTFDTAPTNGHTVLMIRSRDYKQTLDVPTQGGFSEAGIENALDSVVMLVQQLKDLVDRAVKFAVTSSSTGVDFPEPESEKVVGWNTAAGALQNYANPATALTGAQAAQTAAEAAQTAAETAETNAETAETNAETAQTAAEAAQAAAEAAVASLNLPTIGAGDAEKLLTVNGAEDGFEFMERVDAIPSGLVVEWDGLIANIPAGFVVCDGNNGTVNRLGKYMKCVPTAGTDPGSTGGANTHTLTTAQLATHAHQYTLPSDSAGAGGGESDRFKFTTTPNTGNAGSGSAHNNEPGYLETVYIMKT